MSKPNALAFLIALEALFFAALSVALAVPFSFIAAWAALACAFVAIAYLLNWPGIYGKRAGRLRWWRLLPVLPYLAGFWLLCAFSRRWRQASVLDEVAPGIYVGGRLQREDLPKETVRIVDLTSEFSEPESVRSHPGYRCYPVLDGSVPHDEEAFLRILEDIRDVAGTVVFHCDAGRGRAPTAAALGLLWRGIEPDCDRAFRRVTAARPSVSLAASDRAFAERMSARLNCN